MEHKAHIMLTEKYHIGRPKIPLNDEKPWTRLYAMIDSVQDHDIAHAQSLLAS